MLRPLRVLAATILCVFASEVAVAQSLPPPALAGPSGSLEQVRLGESAADLNGPWKFHVGDDPSWAKPDLDDSQWETADLAPPPDGEVPGWTVRGHPGYAGYAWYRLTVDVAGAQKGLAIKMPDADDAYQIFVNGNMIGEFGKFRPQRVVAYGSIPQSFRLPKSIRNGPMTIAIRMWMDSATPFNSPDAGGMHGPPQLGFASAITNEVRLDFDTIAHAVGSGFLEALILFMSLLMAVALFWLDPGEKAYLWLALVCAVTLAGNSIVLLANFTTPLGQTSAVILYDVVSTPVRIGLWVVFWSYWFHSRRLLRLHLSVWSIVAVLAVATAMLRPPLYGETVPVAWSVFLIPFQQIAKLALGVMLFGVAYYGFRRRRAEGGLAASAILFAFVANFQHELRLIHLALSVSPFGFVITLGQMSTIVSLLIITVLLLRRFVLSQRQQEQWEVEIQQAQHVQQVLIPDQLPHIPGLLIKSVYRPAREVGGDFFQIIPAFIGERL